MGFQKSVGLMPAIGLPGQEVNPGQAVYTAFNYVSDGTVQAGTFAFPVALTEGGDQVMNTATFKGKAGDTPLGFVARNFIAAITNPLDESTQTFNKGLGLSIAIRGQFYMTATGEATEGQQILIDPATGKVTYGALEETDTRIETGWVVRLPRGVFEVDEGDLIIAERF